MIDVMMAERVATDLLKSGYPKRSAHVASVAARANEIAGTIGVQSDVLEASAWLHDVGYADAARETGFHPLDGARFIRSRGIGDEVCCLVAYHSCAEVEADLRGLGEQLKHEFRRPAQSLLDVLCYCDMVTGPTGATVSIEDRLSEIRSRYGADHLVARFVDLASADLIQAVRRVEHRLISAQA